MRSLAAALLLALPLSSLQAQEESAAPAEASAAQPDARLTKIEGSVYLRLKDRAEDGFIAAELGAPLAEGDQVRTGTDGRAEVALDDESVIQLAPNTDLIVTSLGEQREVYLGIGSLVAKLKKLLGERQMRFRTPTAVAAVRGTELAVTQEGDEQAVVGVFDEGEVAVTSADGNEAVVLGPHQETECRRGKPPIKPREMKRLMEHRERVQNCRTRFEAMRREWKPRPVQERREFRQRLNAARGLREGQMRNIRRDMQRRDYREMRERFQQRRENRQERRENRQEHRENRQDRRQERREDGHQRQGGNQPGGGDGRNWIRGPGQGQGHEERRENRQERREDRQENRENRQERRDGGQDQQRHGGFQGQPPGGGGGHQGGMGQGGGQEQRGQQGQGRKPPRGRDRKP